MIQGNGSGNLTINLDSLPDSVISLQISSFTSVTFSGSHTVDNLVLRDIQSVKAGAISIRDASSPSHTFITGLYAFDVQRVQIDVAPTVIYLQGAALGVMGQKTLLEVGHFSGGVLVSFLENLGLSSSAGSSEINIISGNQHQTIMLNFQPQRLNISGIDSDSRQVSVIKGDFTRYFLATPTERNALEQSLLIARQSATANVVTVTSLLRNPTVKAALGEGAEGGAGVANIRLRTPAELESASAKVLAPLANNSELAEQPKQSAGKTLTFSPDLLANPVSPVVQGKTVMESTAADHAEALLFGIQMRETTELNLGAGHAAENGAHVAANEPSPTTFAKLAEPFARTAMDLKESIATFGQLASSQVTNYLRTESRPALLVEARAGRQREENLISVVSI